MAATFLKATGQLGGGDEKVTPKVSININLGGREAKVVTENDKLNVDLSDSDYDK